MKNNYYRGQITSLYRESVEAARDYPDYWSVSGRRYVQHEFNKYSAILGGRAKDWSRK
jgi:hypothetical protein